MIMRMLALRNVRWSSHLFLFSSFHLVNELLRSWANYGEWKILAVKIGDQLSCDRLSIWGAQNELTMLRRDAECWMEKKKEKNVSTNKLTFQCWTNEKQIRIDSVNSLYTLRRLISHTIDLFNLMI